MATDTQAGSSKTMIWTGRVISGVVVLMLTFSAVMKFTGSAQVTEEFTRLGWPSIATGLGILEIACTIVYAIPQTAVLGAILLTGYLGGATATHVRIDDPFVGPVIGGVLVWLGIFLRDARLRELVPLRKS
jgi:sorbitol-specific phosphotransferase system component IIC